MTVAAELTGAALLAAGWAAGHITARLRRAPMKPPREICQCGHGAAFHRQDGCNATIAREVGAFSVKHIPCPCVRYVGPSSSYVPELDGPTAKEATRG